MVTSLEKTTAQRLIEILRNSQDIDDKTEITEDTLFYEGLEMDSLDRYEFCYHVEEEFGVKIRDEDIWDFRNIREYVDYLKTHNK